jgi:hypothetical protein
LQFYKVLFISKTTCTVLFPDLTFQKDIVADQILNMINVYSFPLPFTVNFTDPSMALIMVSFIGQSCLLQFIYSRYRLPVLVLAKTKKGEVCKTRLFATIVEKYM